MAQQRKLDKSQGIIPVISFLWRNPRKYYTSNLLFQEIKLNSNTWATSYRPQLLANNIIQIYKGNDPGRKKFKFNEIVFINYAFDKFVKILQDDSKTAIKKLEKIKRKCDKIIDRCQVEYNSLIGPNKYDTTIKKLEKSKRKDNKIQRECEIELDAIKAISKNYSDSIEKLLNKTGLLTILELTGKKDLLKFIISEIYCDEKEFEKYTGEFKEIKKRIKVLDRKIKKYKNIERKSNKKIELKEERIHLIKKVSKLNSFKDGINTIFNTLEAYFHVPDTFRLCDYTVRSNNTVRKDIEKDCVILYPYFILTIEKIFEKENITQFSEFLQKISSLWAVNSEKSLKGQELIIKVPGLPKYEVPSITDICLLNKKLK